MWPQKWKPSASPGSTSFETAPAAVSAAIPLPTRARNPRRDELEARPSSAREIRPPSQRSAQTPSASIRSALGPAPLRGGEDALELGEVVEGALRADGPVALERDRVGRAGDRQRLPDVGVGRPPRRPRPRAPAPAAASRPPARACGRRDSPREVNTARPSSARRSKCEAIDELGAAAELRALLGDLERRGRPEAQPQHADLASERQDRDGQRGAGEQGDGRARRRASRRSKGTPGSTATRRRRRRARGCGRSPSRSPSSRRRSRRTASPAAPRISALPSVAAKSSISAAAA